MTCQLPPTLRTFSTNQGRGAESEATWDAMFLDKVSLCKCQRACLCETYPAKGSFVFACEGYRNLVQRNVKLVRLCYLVRRLTSNRKSLTNSWKWKKRLPSTLIRLSIEGCSGLLLDHFVVSFSSSRASSFSNTFHVVLLGFTMRGRHLDARRLNIFVSLSQFILSRPQHLLSCSLRSPGEKWLHENVVQLFPLCMKVNATAFLSITYTFTQIKVALFICDFVPVFTKLYV